MTFDKSYSRLITAEADKTIKMYREDPNSVRKGGGARPLRCSGPRSCSPPCFFRSDRRRRPTRWTGRRR